MKRNDYHYGGTAYGFGNDYLFIWFSDTRDNTVISHSFSIQIISKKFGFNKWLGI